MRISEWLSVDPTSLDSTRREKQFKVSKEVFDLLISKLKAFHPDYVRDTLGLKLRINFKGYDKPVQALVPYSNEPLKFYKWWCVNQDYVSMTLEEKINLFNKIYSENPKILKKEHKGLIKKYK
jgi:ATP-dependent DNA helicase RecQ